MKKTILSIALSLSMAMMISCGGEKPSETTEPVTEQAAVINTTHAYVCPMNCENSASDKPGQCSVCGMDLVKNPNYKGAVDS
ncbi:MAG TPA: heavy metal-binding domain-containing protein, partial [Bacteroidia bacterium]|nr:heavy metal-binding domain-containing protein [Bacteroidia bacterium]